MQEKLGDTLEEYLFEREEPFSEKTTLQIGIALMDAFRKIHDAGYVYADLKLDNILVGDAKILPNSEFSLYKIRLIDFGLAKPYILPDGSHIPQTKDHKFEGNLMFSSPNAMNFTALSRRDDLISLCYILLYLVEGDLVFMQENSEEESLLQDAERAS